MRCVCSAVLRCCRCRRLAEVIRDKEEGRHLEELAAGGGKTKKAAKVCAVVGVGERGQRVAGFLARGGGAHEECHAAAWLFVPDNQMHAADA